MRRDVQKIIDQADELADYFESGFSSNDPEEIAQLRAAAHRRAVAEADVAKGVAAAVSAGQSWRSIGEALGTTGEAARQRYGKFVSASSPEDKGEESRTPVAKRVRSNRAAAATIRANQAAAAEVQRSTKQSVRVGRAKSALSKAATPKPNA